MEDGDFEILSADEMREKYGLTAKSRKDIFLDPRNVPPGLWKLIPLAECWGVGDDLIREDLLRDASDEAVLELRRMVAAHDDLLDEWLAGPEADSEEPSPEYLAFSAMRMASDGV